VVINSTRFRENTSPALRHESLSTWLVKEERAYYYWDNERCREILKFLETLAPQTLSSQSLHATISAELFVDIGLQTSGLTRPQTGPRTITYDICDLALHDGTWGYIKDAFALQAVVHFDTCPQTHSWDDGEILQVIIYALQHCLSDPPDGQLFICGITDLVLTEKELETSLDMYHEALLKIYNGMKEHLRPKWEIFKGKVHLVEPGFRPSADDLARGGR
jgi:hypothetical protein